MYKKLEKILVTMTIFCAAALVLSAAATTAHAQAYIKLLVLLPGETAAPGTPSGKTGAPSDQTVGVPFNIRVLACDDSYNLVTSITHIVSITSTDESATLPPNTQLINGQAEMAITMNAAGSFTVTANDESDPTIPDATSSYVTVQALYGFLFSDIDQKHMYAGTPRDFTLTAVDPTGQRVTGFNGVVRLKELTSFGDGRIDPEAVTLVNGFWSGQLTMFRADETSINRGNVNIYAYLESNPSKNGTSDPLIVHPGPYARVQLVVPGQDPLPGSITGIIGTPATQAAAQSFVCDVYATDDYWNQVESSDDVRITSSDPAANTPVTGKMNVGHVQINVTLGTVGAQTLTVTNITNGTITGMTSDPIQVIPAAPDHFEISTIASPQVAGVPVEVTIRATDINSNTITDYFGDAILAANTGANSISPQAIAFTNGVWTGDMIFKGAGGAVSFTCSDFSSPPHTGMSNSFQVLPGPYVGLQVLLPGQTAMGGTETGFTGWPTSHNAGSGFTINVRAVDEFWNLVPTINDLITLSSTDQFANMPADTTLENGAIAIPVILYKGGFQTITAADADSTSKNPHTSSPVEIVAGSYSRILLVAPGEEVAPGTETGRYGEATDQSINYSFTVSVYATDSWWNPVAGITDQIRITSSDPLAELPPDAYMTDGVAQMSIRLSTGGYQQITATNLTQPIMPVSTTQVCAITSGFHLEAAVDPSTVQAGGPFTLTVKVTNDAGAVIEEINSFINIEVLNASTQEPGRGTLLTTQFQLLQGQRSITETYTYAEPIILVASDDQGNDPAVTDVLIVTPGVPSRIELVSNPSWVGGNKHATVNATVMDDFDNGVPDREVDFELISGEGTLTPLDTMTNDDGLAQADFLSTRFPGISVVRATSGALIAELEIETSLVDPNAPGGMITNYPNPFHPGEIETTIAYKLSDNANVTLRIYTISGSLVLRKDFTRGEQGGTVGLNEYHWDGRNGNGDIVASGGYIVVVEAEGNGETLHVMRRRVAVVR